MNNCPHCGADLDGKSLGEHMRLTGGCPAARIPDQPTLDEGRL